MSIDKLIIPVTAVQEHVVPYGAMLLYGTLRALSGGKDSFELSCITEDVADWFNVSVSTINAWFGSLIDAAYIDVNYAYQKRRRKTVRYIHFRRSE